MVSTILVNIYPSGMHSKYFHPSFLNYIKEDTIFNFIEIFETLYKILYLIVLYIIHN